MSPRSRAGASFTGIAQLVEHWSPKPGVGSSSLSTRAKIYDTMNIVNYCKESYNELVHKTTWPSMSELTNSAVIVLVASLITSLIIWLIDLGFEEIMKFVYGLLA